MKNLSNLIENDFVVTVMQDGELMFAGFDIDITGIELPNLHFNEAQFFVHNVGFYLVHCLTWFKQLDYAVEFLANYDYSKRLNTNRADHLIYNIENYFIRFNSVYDRILQIVNAVFHLCINEESVNHDLIMSNLKVARRSEIKSEIKGLRKFLSDYAQKRNTIIHKHSLQDVGLRKIELFYAANIEELKLTQKEKSHLKLYRAKRLKEYISEKKVEFGDINVDLFDKLNSLFLSLKPEYQRQKQRIESSPW